jgi:tetratricopeptide (TPR) repeat protein
MQNDQQRDSTSQVLAGTLFSLLFGLYAFTAAPQATFHDSGEFVTAGYTLGIPHPPGSPTWVLVAHLFSCLPVGSPGYRVNLSCGFFAALTCALVYLLVQRVLRQKARPDQMRWTHWAGVFAALALGQSPAFWEKAVQTEIYAQNAFYQVLLLYLLEIWIEREAQKDARHHRVLAAMALVFGIGAGNYLAILYYVPVVGAVVLWRNWRLVLEPRTLLLVAGGFALGMAVFLYLPIRSPANPPLDWGNPETWGNWMSVMKRERWGNFHFGDKSWEFVWLWLQTYRFPRELGWPALVLALGGAGYLLRRFPIQALVYAGFFFMYWLVMMLMQATTPALLEDFYYVKTYGMGEFHIPLYTMLAIFAGLGLYGAITWLREHNGARGEQLAKALAMAGVLVVLAQYAINFPWCNYRHFNAPFLYGQELLVRAPQGSWVVPAADNDLGSVTYLKFCTHQREDITLAAISPSGYERLAQVTAGSTNPSLAMVQAVRKEPTRFIDPIFNESALLDAGSHPSPEVVFLKCPRNAQMSRQLCPDGLVFKFGQPTEAGLHRQEGFWQEYLARPECRPDPAMKADARENLYQTLSNHGYWHELAGQFTLAAELYQRALAYTPPSVHADLYARMASCQLERKQFDQAFADAMRALDLEPNHVDALTTVGITCVAWKKYDQAIRCFETILKLAPTNGPAQANLKLATRQKNAAHEQGKHP